MAATDTSGSGNDHSSNGRAHPASQRAVEEEIHAAIFADGVGDRLPLHEPHRPRRAGFLIGMAKTRKGGADVTETDVRKTAATRGALRGHTAATQESDVMLAVMHADAVARERAASLARQALEQLADAARRRETARRTETRATALVEEITPTIQQLDAEIEQVEQQVTELAAAAPPPPKPPPRDAQDTAAAIAARTPVSPSLLRRILVCSLFGGGVESFFSGTFSSDAGVFGLPGLPPELNLAIPWVAGLAIGVLIVLGAALAGQINGRVRNPGNPAFGPWWRGHAASLWLGAVGLFVAMRAVYGFVAFDAAAGALGVAVGAIMLGIAIISAAAAAELERREQAQALAQATHAVREENRFDRTPPPSQEEIERDAWRRRLDDLEARVARLGAERGRLRSIAHLAQDEAAQAEVDVHAEVAGSRLQAAQEDGLADVAIAIDVLRANAVEATYHDELPATLVSDPARVRRRPVGGELAHVKVEDVLPDEEEQV